MRHFGVDEKQVRAWKQKDDLHMLPQKKKWIERGGRKVVLLSVEDELLNCIAC